jgi:Na+-transporting methylmalonyl-CoA/oxaloacetate decarboxylase gamma subunit
MQSLIPFPLPALAARLPDQPSLAEILQFQLTGLLVVLAALALLWIFLETTGAVFRRIERAKPEAAGEKAPATGKPGEIPAAHVAILAAAIHEAVGSAHTILGIREVHTSDELQNAQLLAWSAEGRRQIFSSHRVR